MPTSGVGTLGTGSVAAHEREVKAIAVSKDVAVLVSASADSTLKVWNLENDNLQWTLAGHRDEVCDTRHSRRRSVNLFRRNRPIIGVLSSSTRVD